MPELPEVETICRGLAKALAHKRLSALELRRKDLRFPFPKGVETALRNKKLLRVERRAKYILMHFEGSHSLILHLGMSGRLTVDDGKKPPAKHDHVLFHFGPKKRLCFNDARRFGMLDMCATEKLTAHKLLRGLGPEPLEKNFTGAVLFEKTRSKKQPIKLAVMDQRVVVGVGNIYASEALFYAGISPKRAAGKLTLDECHALVAAIKKVLNYSISVGGSSLRDYVHADGGLGYFQNAFAVYGSKGEACKNCTCDTDQTGGIKRIVQGGRASFFCPKKQK